jgi:hypothetical protein
MLLVGRLEFEEPKPCGPRPESVVFPCAFQERPLLPVFGRAELAELMEAEERDPIVDGGRFAESCDCRFAGNPCDVLRLPEKPCCEVPFGLLAAPAPNEELLRADVLEVLMRFCTDVEGREMLLCMLDAPK